MCQQWFRKVEVKVEGRRDAEVEVDSADDDDEDELPFWTWSDDRSQILDSRRNIYHKNIPFLLYYLGFRGPI